MKASTLCPIWGVPSRVSRPERNTTWVENSFRAGGDYQLSWDAENEVPNLTDGQKARLTSWLIEQRRVGDDSPHVTLSEIEHARSRRALPVAERAERLLQYLVMSSPRIGEPVDIVPPNPELIAALALPTPDESEFVHYQTALAWSESIDNGELEFLANYLTHLGWITKGTQIRTDRTVWGSSSSMPSAYLCMVEIPGYSRVEEVSTNPESDKCFVAMWFDPTMDDVYDWGISPAIRAAGYEPRRIDRQDDLIGKIDDAIVAEIRRSRFVVADFTHGESGARGGVYYEAGFAHGLGIPVIFLCRKDMIREVHFDTRQFNHIVWEDADDLAKRLTDKIMASIGEGPHPEN